MLNGQIQPHHAPKKIDEASITLHVGGGSVSRIQAKYTLKKQALNLSKNWGNSFIGKIAADRWTAYCGGADRNADSQYNNATHTRCNFEWDNSNAKCPECGTHKVTIGAANPNRGDCRYTLQLDLSGGSEWLF